MSPGRFLCLLVVVIGVALPTAGCAKSGRIADDLARSEPRPIDPGVPQVPNRQLPQVPGGGGAGVPRTAEEGAQAIRNDAVRRVSSDRPVDWRDRVCKAHDAADRYLDAQHDQRVQDVIYQAQLQGIVMTRQQAEEAIGYVEGKDAQWGTAMRKAAFGIYCVSG